VIIDEFDENGDSRPEALGLKRIGKELRQKKCEPAPPMDTKLSGNSSSL